MKKSLFFIFVFLCFLTFPLLTKPLSNPTAGLLTTNNGYKIKTVVIDAGHGGKDGGCSGVNSKEKHVVLGIALKLGKYIQKNMPNVKVIYTRKKDVFVPLHKRADIANTNNADLFISIHCNAAAKHKHVHGTETYVMGSGASPEAMEVSARENAVIRMETDYKKHYDGFDLDDPESQIIFSLYQNAFLDQSIQFADLIEKQFKYKAKRKSRGVKQQNFLVLYKTAMPSVLIESGFLSNKYEESYLKKPHGQTYIASAIFRAFKGYKEMVEGKSVK